MFLPKKNISAKRKTVKATADFYQSQQRVGKIIADNFHNVKIFDGLQSVGAFTPQREQTVYQILPNVRGAQCYLTPNGVEASGVTLGAFANCQKVAYAYDQVTGYLAISHPNVGTYFIQEDTASRNTADHFESLAFCQGRLFGLRDNTVYLSQPADFALDEGEQIPLDSQVVALVANRELFAVGKSIYKLTLDADDTHVVVSEIVKNVGDFVADTVVTYGNKIVGVANGRLVAIYGNIVKPLCDSCFDAICAVMRQGLYCLLCNVEGQRYVLGINLHSGEIVFRMQTTATQIFDGQRLQAIIANRLCVQGDTTATACWQSLPINFDNQNTVKHLQRLYLQTQYPLQVTVNADIPRTYDVEGSDRVQCLPICGFARDVTVKLQSQGPLKVKGLQIVANLYS